MFCGWVAGCVLCGILEHRVKRRLFASLLLILLLLALAGGLLWQDGTPDRPDRAPTIAVTESHEAAGPAEAAAQKPVPSIPVTRHAAPVPDPQRYRRAYLLSLDGGKLSLENVQDIEGDFSVRRAPEEEWSGMLRCRLFSAEGVVLAEELIPAPDHLCTVLDAHTGDPKPVSFAVAGPVVFQLRLPRIAEATRLDVSRVTNSGALKRDQPVGSLSLVSQ
jgi:hypothetical protein